MELSAQFLCALFKRGNDELTNTSCHTHAMLILQGSQVWSPREYSLFTSALFSCKLTFFSPDSPGVFSPGTKTFLIKNVLVIPYRASVTKSPTKSLKIQTETKHPINLNYAHTSINTHPMDFHPKFLPPGIAIRPIVHWSKTKSINTFIFSKTSQLWQLNLESHSE